MTYINTYQLISTFDGSTETCSLSELSRNLKLNCILAELNADSSVSDSWPLVHSTLVTFAVEFADYALKNYTQQKIPEAEACLVLTRKWLKNANSVSNEELTAAAYAANAAANAADAARAAARAAAYAAADAAADAAAYAADAAAANAADAAYAAAAAAYAAYAAGHAANAVANAARDAAGKGREAELIRQGGFVVEYLMAA